jgi:sugar O-acyltransferase (sialic acid O-acetyltransferase NeuD family)
VAAVVLIGGGGHARVLIDALRAGGEHMVTGIVDLAQHVGEVVDGVLVVGTDADLARLRAEGADACAIAIGSAGDPRARVRAAQLARDAGFTLVTVVHPRAVVSSAATLGEGAFVAAGAVVGPGAEVGVCTIVNSGAVVDHDCVLGDFVHVAPGAALSGGVVVGELSHIGTGAAVKQGVRIGARTVVGVGSAVVGDVPDGVVAFGDPCRVVREAGW